MHFIVGRELNIQLNCFKNLFQMKQLFPDPLPDDRRPPVEAPWVKPLTHANMINLLVMINYLLVN